MTKLRKRSKSRQTAAVDLLSIELAKWFGTTVKFTTIDIRIKTKVKLTPGEIRGAINHMHNSGLLLRRGVSKGNGYGLWMLTTRGLIRANRAAWRIECDA
jgi:hypothetical protein